MHLSFSRLVSSRTSAAAQSTAELRRLCPLRAVALLPSAATRLAVDLCGLWCRRRRDVGHSRTDLTTDTAFPTRGCRCCTKVNGGLAPTDMSVLLLPLDHKHARCRGSTCHGLERKQLDERARPRPTRADAIPGPVDAHCLGTLPWASEDLEICKRVVLLPPNTASW